MSDCSYELQTRARDLFRGHVQSRDSKGHVTVRVCTQYTCVQRTTPRVTRVCALYPIPTYQIPTLTIIKSIRITRCARYYID